MAQNATTLYKTNANKTVRAPVFELSVAWGRTADTFPDNWSTQGVIESTRIRSVSWTRQLDTKGSLATGSSPVAAMTLELENYDNRYSPYNESGPLYSSLLATTATAGGVSVSYPQLWQVPLRVRVGFEASELLTMFTGLIDEPGETYGVNGSQVSFRCLDVGGVLLKRKLSTKLKKQINPRDWMIYLMQVALGDNASKFIGNNMDSGFFFIPYAWLDDEDAYSECSKAAASEGGYFFFNELGKSVFRNAAWWARASTTSVYTFTVAKFTDITPGYDWQSVATGALVEYQGRQPAGEQVVWKSSGVIVVPPSPDGSTPGETTIDARLEFPCEDVYPPTLVTDWLPINAGGVALSDVVEWVMSHDTQSAAIRIKNYAHETAFITRMQLRGLALYGGPTEQVKRNVAVPLVPTNVLRYADNPYVQTKPQADLLADLAADRMQYPRLTYRLDGVPAIPWLQLGDRITITATEPITTSRDAIITKLDFRWQVNSLFTMSIEAVDAAGLFQYPTFFVLGTSVYNSSTEVLFR